MRIQQTIFVLMALLCTGSIAWAGPLATAPNAYVDGGGYVWHGTAPFLNTSNPSLPSPIPGHIDWAVFLNPAVPDGMAGYAPILHYYYLYTYQLYFDAPEFPLALDLFLDGLFLPNNLGTFLANGVAGQAPTDVGMNWEFGTVRWQFAGAASPFQTLGIAFTSDAGPSSTFALLTSGDEQIVAGPVPFPGVMPEPSTFALAAAALVGFAAWCHHRRPVTSAQLR